MVAIPPAAEAKKVLTTTAPINSQLPTAPNEEPGLNPNHPNHSMNAPTEAKGKLCPGMVLEVPSFEYFPILGPNHSRSQCRKSSHGVDGCRARKIIKTSDGQPTIGIPNPIGNQGIHDAAEKDHHDRIGPKFHPFRQSSRYDRNGGYCKPQLIEPKQLIRNC